jgi:PTS system cellobiose-specific IIC component
MSFVAQKLAPALNAFNDLPVLSAIRSGMVAVVPLTIIGGLFTAIGNLPIHGWDQRVAPWRALLDVPVTATFGLLGVFVCLAIAYDLGRRWRQEPLASASLATLAFLLIQIDPQEQKLAMKGLGSAGIFTGIIVALLAVGVQRLFTTRHWVIRLPPSVPTAVQESFLSLLPLFALVVGFWILRFLLNVDINRIITDLFAPLVLSLNTLPGILVYAFLVTLLWSVGINGDNTLDAVVASVFLQYLAENVEAIKLGLPPPHITANGFFTTFVNVGGTGATIALALIMFFSRDPGYRQISRLSMPTQVFQINEPIFFGFPIVLNPIFMIPYILSALLLTTGSFLLMHWNVISKPFVAVPWTTPPVIGHYLATGGDWRAALWGVLSIGLAMAVYFPFAKVAERRRLTAAAAAVPR